MKVQPRNVFDLFVVMFFAFLIWEARDWPTKAQLYPLVVGIPMLVLATFHFFAALKNERQKDGQTVAPPDLPENTPADFQFTKGIDPALARKRTIDIFLWIFGFLGACWLAGFVVAIPLFVFLYLKVKSREGWVLSLILTSGAWLLFWGLFKNLLHLPFPDAQIYSWLGL